MKLNKQHSFYFRSMGKVLRVTAIFTNDNDANEYMSKNRDEGVIAVVNGYVFLANVYDKGIKVPKQESS